MAKRKSEAVSPTKYQAKISTTPAKARASKKVRFSTSSVHPNASLPSDTTGLTPAVKNTMISTPKRRASTPARTGRFAASSPASDFDFVQFTPLRQALDDRCKRRIRRNGLSEIVNDYDTEKRDNTHLRHEIRRKDNELKQLKAELEQLNQRPKSAGALMQSEDAQSKVDEVEAELAQLRRSFGVEPAGSDNHWDYVPRMGNGPSSAGGDTVQIFEDDADPYHDQSRPAGDPAADHVDATLMSLELASARQAKQDMLSSFSRNSRSFNVDTLDFADSPKRPSSHADTAFTPRTNAHELKKQLAAAQSCADDAELALTALEGEVRALGFSRADDSSATACTSVLADHFREIRLELERLMPGESTISFDNPRLFPELMSKLKQLSHKLSARDVELQSLRNQERSLRGNFDHAIVAAEKAQNKVKELEKSIEDAAEETLLVRMRSRQLERDLEERHSDVDKLQAALNAYRDEVDRLESLICQVESDHKTAMAKVQSNSQNWETVAGDMEAKAISETTGRRKAEESAVSRLARIQELETILASVKEDAESTAAQLQALQAKENRLVEDVDELRIRNSHLSTALASTEAEVSKLKAINEKLEARWRAEAEEGQLTIEKMQHELIKFATKATEAGKGYRRGSKVRLANWELESDDYPTGEDGMPLTPASTVRFADHDECDNEVHGGASSPSSEHVPGSVEMGRGKKRLPLTPAINITKRGRRRYDSGIGMSPLGEESEAAVDADGLISPDLSSEADVDMAVEA